METQIFEFKDYRVPVQIAGIPFSLDCSADTGVLLKESGGELYRLARGLQHGDDPQEAMDYCCQLLDTLLGDGAVEKIFSQRKKTLRDVVEVCSWLTDLAIKYGECSE